jgi:hypothetical protein
MSWGTIAHFLIINTYKSWVGLARVGLEPAAPTVLYHERDCVILPIRVVTLFVVASSSAVTNYVYLVVAKTPVTSPPRISYPNVALFTDIARFRYENILFACSASERVSLAKSAYWPMLCSSKVLSLDSNSLASSLKNTNQLTVAQL